jgi:hypothetical protein
MGMMFCRNFDRRIHGGIPDLTLTTPVVSKFACLKALPALPFGKIYQKRLYLGHIGEFANSFFLLARY